jgi:hypothetical protein
LICWKLGWWDGIFHHINLKLFGGIYIGFGLWRFDLGDECIIEVVFLKIFELIGIEEAIHLVKEVK